MHNKRESDFPYILHVTWRDVWDELKYGLEAWFILSIVSLVLVFLFGSLGIRKVATGKEWSSLAHWAWQAAFFCALLWFLRGKEIRFKVPSLTHRSWIINSLVFILIVFILATFPLWLSLPVCWAISTFDTVLDKLIETGKFNYTRKHGGDDGSGIGC